MNTFGLKFRVTTFGESHGEAIGCIIDGVPAGLKIDEQFIQSELDRRKPGQSDMVTARNESDIVHIQSGVFEGFSTGTPISLVIYNTDQKSKDYSNIKDLFRPGHADFTYFNKYGIRDYRGGGRSSARETALRVASGAIAKLILHQFNIIVQSGVAEIDGIKSENIDFEYSKINKLYVLDKDSFKAQESAVIKAKKSHDSVGGVVLVNIKNTPIGLGEPLYYKLDAVLASNMMGINGVKAVEIGDGCKSSHLNGSENNDDIGMLGFKSNHSGGVLGGISNGDDINIKIFFKPTPSIAKSQQTIDINNNELTFNLKGRHDPCIAIRGSVVAESMAALTIVDMLLLNTSSTMVNIKKVYSK